MGVAKYVKNEKDGIEEVIYLTLSNFLRMTTWVPAEKIPRSHSINTTRMPFTVLKAI